MSDGRELDTETARIMLWSIKSKAGDLVLLRGEKYAKEDRVKIIRLTGDLVRATVWGTQTYKVNLTRRKKDWLGDCDCPAYRNGICKHIVAVALTAAGASMPVAAAASRVTTQTPTSTVSKASSYTPIGESLREQVSKATVLASAKLPHEARQVALERQCEYCPLP